MAGGLIGAVVAAALPVVQGAGLALLAVVGALLAAVVAIWGALHVYVYFEGGSASDVSYRVGRIFGEAVYESDYRAYAEGRAADERLDGFKRRYERDPFEFGGDIDGRRVSRGRERGFFDE